MNKKKELYVRDIKYISDGNFPTLTTCFLSFRCFVLSAELLLFRFATIYNFFFYLFYLFPRSNVTRRGNWR